MKRNKRKVSVNGLTNNGSILGTAVTPLNLSQMPALPALPAISPGTLRQRTEATGAFFGKWVQVGQQVKLTLGSRFGL